MYPKGNLYIPASVGQLEAILKEPYCAAKGVAVVCHPHPLGGGTMHNKVVFRTAAGLIDAGLITLRFNFRGVGNSDGNHDGSAEVQDVRDAIDFICTHYPNMDLTLAGFSFGSRMAAEVAINDERVKRLIMIGTPVDKYNDFHILTAIRKSVLFVHGDSDEFGAESNLRKLVDSVNRETETEIVIFKDCGHFFDQQLDELRNTVRKWVSEQLKRGTYGEDSVR